VASAFHQVDAGIKSNSVPRWNRVYNPAPTFGTDTNLDLIPQLESTPWNRFQFLKSLKIWPLAFNEAEPGRRVVACSEGWMSQL